MNVGDRGFPVFFSFEKYIKWHCNKRTNYVTNSLFFLEDSPFILCYNLKKILFFRVRTVGQHGTEKTSVYQLRR